MVNEEQLEEEAKATATSYARTWGESSLPPLTTATLIAAQHARPIQFLPLMFAPMFLFSTYMNLNGYTKDAAGTSAAWSGLYLVLARRRKQPFVQKWAARGLIRGGTMGLCLANLLGGGFVYAITSRKGEGGGKIGNAVA